MFWLCAWGFFIVITHPDVSSNHKNVAIRARFYHSTGNDGCLGKHSSSEILLSPKSQLILLHPGLRNHV